MAAALRNKTLATLLAATVGCAGLHRFYLYGRRDTWGWVHAASLPLSALGWVGRNILPPAFSIFLLSPLIVSVLAAMLEALVLGLTPDAKWDAAHNPGVAGATESNWLLAVILILTLACGMGGLIFAISRAFDLIFTGGAYG